MRGTLGRCRDRECVLPFPIAAPLCRDIAGPQSITAGLLVLAQLQRVAVPWPVDDIARDLQRRQDLAHALHIVADLFWKQCGLRPGLAENLGHGEVPVRVIKEELEELKLTSGHYALPILVSNRSPCWIQPQAVEIPNASRPALEA